MVLIDKNKIVLLLIVHSPTLYNLSGSTTTTCDQYLAECCILYESPPATVSLRLILRCIIKVI